MTQHGHEEALDAPIDVPGDAPAGADTSGDDATKPKDASVVDTLFKEGSDAPDAADIEDPSTQI